MSDQDMVWVMAAIAALAWLRPGFDNLACAVGS